MAGRAFPHGVVRTSQAKRDYIRRPHIAVQQRSGQQPRPKSHDRHRDGSPGERSAARRQRRSARKSQLLGARRSAASASSTAISAPARSMRCANRCRPRVGAGNAATEPVVLGILSLIIWALIVIVTIKYVVILLRADNNGEGGTLALMALAQRAVSRGGAAIVLLGIISGALFYGDAILTPALVGAVGGRRLEDRDAGVRALCRAADGCDPVALFAVQSRGTASVAAFFGPIMPRLVRCPRGRRLVAHRPESRPCCGPSIRPMA